MDPLNNSTTTPNPSPTPNPAPVPDPVSPVNPVQPSGNPTQSTIPTQPTAPVQPIAPAQSSGSFSQSMNATTTQPVGPVGSSSMNHVFKPAGVGVAATEPIMMPEQPKAPDPVEEELKAPMKAAAPAPGSIGSAVSGPTDTSSMQDNVGPGIDQFAKTQTPNVSFSDPAMQPAVVNSQAVNPVKKKNSKNALIALIVVAVLVIVALGVVFAMQFIDLGGNGFGGGSGSSGSSSNSSNSSSQNSSGNSSNGSSSNSSSNANSNTNTNANTDTNATNNVVCSFNYSDEKVGTVAQTMTFSVEKNKLTAISIVTNTTSTDGETSTTEQNMDVESYITEDDLLLQTDGTLKVSVSELATKMQETLNKQLADSLSNSTSVSVDSTYLCVVK